MNNSVNQSRVDFDKLGGIYPIARNVKIDKEVIDNIDCYWFKNIEKLNFSKIAIYLHGGCFVLGSVRSHQALVSHLAKSITLPFIFVEYGLAPENPFPNAINDLLKVYQYLLIKYPKKEIILIGDSAGAGLSISLLSRINEIGLQAPKFVIMISPWIDLSCTNSSITMNADLDSVLKKERLLELANLYVGDQDLFNVNPKENLPEKFPPTLILVGSDEILLDDSKFIYNMILRTKTKTKLSIYEKQSHVWLLENINTVQSQTAIKEICTFIID
jgi:monoterpene epsilon-lactone hydrolase